MTSEDFRAALNRLGLTQAELGRQLAALRPETAPSTWPRTVRSWATGTRRIPVEMEWALDRLQEQSQGQRMPVGEHRTTNEALGMAWWNGLTEAERRFWVGRAGTAVPASAWEHYKQEVRPSLSGGSRT